MNVVLATSNQHKINEIKRILSQHGDFTAVPISALVPYQPPKEDGKTYLENATLKAITASKLVDDVVIAEDSGVEVDALNNQPGILSARYSGPEATDESNNKKLLDEIRDVSFAQRTCRYVCTAVVAHKGKPLKNATGICEGLIAFHPVGENGFGYDPIFFVPQYGKTFGQLPPTIKSQISHRARAIKEIAAFLLDYAQELRATPSN